jgi:C4-dicarboxylate transporter DctQ subunit
VSTVLRWLDRLEEIVISALIAAATALVFVAVAQRYSLSAIADILSWARANDYAAIMDAAKQTFRFVSSFNLTWAQELTIYMFVWMAKFGAAYGVRTGIHVGVDVLVNRVGPPIRKSLILFGLLAGAVFTAIVGTIGAGFVWDISQTAQVSPDLEMPIWIVYLAIPLGSFLMCFRFLQAAFSYYRSGELPHYDHGHVDGVEEAKP